MHNYWLIFFTFGGQKGVQNYSGTPLKKGATIKSALLLIIPNAYQTDMPNLPASFHAHLIVLLFSCEKILKMFRVDTKKPRPSRAGARKVMLKLNLNTLKKNAM